MYPGLIIFRIRRSRGTLKPWLFISVNTWSYIRVSACVPAEVSPSLPLFSVLINQRKVLTCYSFLVSVREHQQGFQVSRFLKASIQCLCVQNVSRTLQKPDRYQDTRGIVIEVMNLIIICSRVSRYNYLLTHLLCRFRIWKSITLWNRMSCYRLNQGLTNSVPNFFSWICWII